MAVFKVYSILSPFQNVREGGVDLPYTLLFPQITLRVFNKSNTWYSYVYTAKDMAGLVCLYVENSQSSRPAAAAPVDGKNAASTGGGDENSSNGAADFGETIYTAVCEQLRINRVQRVIDGLSTASLNLKYRCLGPLGAKALAAALCVSSVLIGCC